MLKVEMAYLESAYITQPPLIDFKHAYRVIGLRHQCNPIKIKSVKLEIECISVNPTQEGEMTYHRCARAVHPLVNPSKGCLKGHRPRRRCRRFKIKPINVSRMQEDGNVHLRCVNVIRSTRRPKKLKGRLDKLTIESRMLGELWHDVEDHG